MTIRFTPLGVPVSSSRVVNSSLAQVSANTPTTASLSGVGLNLTGSIGDSYLTVSASSGPLPNLGLVVGS
jgi:hypothetical protein